MSRSFQVSVSRINRGFKDIAEKAAKTEGISLSHYIIKEVKASKSYKEALKTSS